MEVGIDPVTIFGKVKGDMHFGGSAGLYGCVYCSPLVFVQGKSDARPSASFQESLLDD